MAGALASKRSCGKRCSSCCRCWRPTPKRRLQWCYALSYVLAVAYSLWLVIHIASVDPLRGVDEAEPPMTQFTWSSHCSQPMKSNVYSCTGCRAMHGPPDASAGCGFSCNAALIHMNDQRNATKGTPRHGTGEATFSWEVDSSRPVTLKIYEPWRLQGRGSIQAVWLTRDNTKVKGWFGNNTGIRESVYGARLGLQAPPGAVSSPRVCRRVA